MHANKQNPIDYIEAGYWSGSWFKDIKTGDTLCDENPNYS
jgi:elongation factor G